VQKTQNIKTDGVFVLTVGLNSDLGTQCQIKNDAPSLVLNMAQRVDIMIAINQPTLLDIVKSTMLDFINMATQA
jgi:hypothetical protein